MKIKAKVEYELHEVYIIDFVTRHENYTYAVYINKNGKVGACNIVHVDILDQN
jgi:hypothetical protein